MKLRLNMDLMKKAAVILILLATGQPAVAAPYYFSRNLSQGMNGEDVRQLQMMLNSDPDTEVSSSGIGSSGQESMFFGALTRDAVVRFQEKFAESVLTPNGLARGTGYVGVSTRNELNMRALAQKTDVNAWVASSSASIGDQNTAQNPSAKKAELVATGPSKVPPDQINNPNFKNYDLFLAAIDKRAAETGLSADDVSKIKSTIAYDLSTTTDLRQKFLNQLERTAVLEIEKGSFFGQKLLSLSLKLEKLLRVPEANAFLLKRDFSGKLIFPYYCSCSANYIVVMMPMAPDFVYMLSYTPFSQRHLWYNMPDAQEFLGKYNPSQGQCSIPYGYGCYTITTEGTIDSIVGSTRN